MRGGYKKEDDKEGEIIVAKEDTDKFWKDLCKDSKKYPDVIRKELFSPNKPWKSWAIRPHFKIETRISERGLLVIHSNAIINESADEIVRVIRDYANRPKWDHNFS